MSEYWANRERQTNKLVRMAADYVFTAHTPTAEQLYGLCKLTWITNSYEGNDAAYIRSTKIPALENVFQTSYSRWSLDEIAEDLALVVENKKIIPLVRAETGSTNFYSAFRNSAKEWIADNRRALVPLFKQAREISSDEEGLEIVRGIEKLLGIPKANNKHGVMRPEYLLTPTFFALDRRLRFPIINGNKGVQNLLRKMKLTNSALTEQYQSMVNLYGRGGIKDAADLDQVGRNLPDYFQIGATLPKKMLLGKKPIETGRELPLKDESDIKSLQKARSRINKRKHNKMTNDLRAALSTYSLSEGADKSIMYDVMIENYNGENDDLLIEVKSSTESAHIRMAVGQLYDYWFLLNGMVDPPHLAVLLPSKPNEKIQEMLKWLDVGLLWFLGGKLATNCGWLSQLTDTD
jgi:hypothetical protein